MKKILPLIILFVFSFSAIHAEIKWEISNDGTLTISGTDMPDYNTSNKRTPWYSRREEIKKVVIEDGVTNIGKYAFYVCTNLTSITIPNSVTSIGSQAFWDCENLTSITIPNSVTSIESQAFWNCVNLPSITIPNSVTSIGSQAFYSCYGLSSIIVEEGNKYYDSRDNCNAIITTKYNTLIIGCKNTVIPNSVTSIGSEAFQYCEGLCSITIPNSVASIGLRAFLGTGLTSITIPNSVTSIGSQAFDFCYSITFITFKGSTPPEVGNHAFYGQYNTIKIFVPSISIDAYKEALEGSKGINIQANPKQLFLTGSESYTQDSQIDDIDVSFTRNFTKYWEPLYIPFSLKYEDWKDDFEVARINGIHQYDDNDDGNIDRTILEFVKMKNDDSVIEPNTPYLIKAKNSSKKTISVENTTLYEAKANQIECTTTTESFIFTGLYKKLSVWSIPQFANGKNYAMYEGNLSEEITTLSNIGPYRWYMTRENRNSVYGINNNNTAKEISIRVVGEETTGIANIQHTSPNTQTYDLNGRKVNENNLKPGMYVKNGRKVIVR